jgi:type III restriction enzyme
MFILKNYQENTLAVLKNYLEQARFKGASTAFKESAQKEYKPLQGLEQVPFICLRLPTGGGKTLLSALTIPIASQAYLETEFPLVLWLVPTNTIRKQTLETLKKPNHPNHESLRKAFDGKFIVIDIEDFEQIRPQDIKSKAVIVLGTIQTLRVDKTEGRKVYAHNENLEPHFTKVAQHTTGLERAEEGNYAGQIKFSFRNLLTLHRPLVIVDEAHNASSPLSFEVLERINPSCVVEYTATPELKTSNVLYNVSASELKAEEMIKLPIMLAERSNWQEAISDSIRTREYLNELAQKDKDYIRPIVLFQAENKDKEVTQAVVLGHLVSVEKIDRTRIAIVTGEQRELDDVNLFDPNCTIDYVITVEALKEGWDCSFAYVFCSLANVKSKTSIEQLLGRVLRMPYAKRREQDELNKAYAFVTSQSWGNTVSFLHDRLVSMGFDQQEADSYIEQGYLGLEGG